MFVKGNICNLFRLNYNGIMKEYRVKDPIYQIPIQIFRGVSLDDFMDKFGSKWSRNWTYWRTCFHPSWACLIWLSDLAWPDMLVHELFHAIHLRLKQKWISPMNLSWEETYAYVLWYFFKEFTKKGIFKKRKTVRSSIS